MAEPRQGWGRGDADAGGAEGEPREAPFRQAIVQGALIFAFFGVASQLAEQGAAGTLWIVLLVGAAARGGFLHPADHFPWAMALLTPQYALVVLLGLLGGPQASGAPATALAATLMHVLAITVLSPLPFLAAFIASRLGRRRMMALGTWPHDA